MSVHARIDEDKWWALLKEIIMINTGGDGSFQTGIRGVLLHRRNQPETSVSHFMEPVLVIMVQGAKYVRIGAEDYKYSARECFVSAIDMPVSSCVMEASQELPYLSISIELNMETIASSIRV